MADPALRELPPQARFLLQGEASALADCGFPAPPAMLRASQAATRATLWLGPDEWLLLAEPGAAMPAAAGASLVDVSDRFRALRLVGARAALLLNEGCPLDFDPVAFPPGACTRTLFGKAEVVLWREGEAQWRLEVARSLTPYVLGLLEEARRDL